MIINRIDWIGGSDHDAYTESAYDAVVTVDNGVGKPLECFCCPCKHKEGDIILQPLRCFSAENCMRQLGKEERIEQRSDIGPMAYKIWGCIENYYTGIVRSCGFQFKIDSKHIPKDIHAGDFIEFETTRIDLY